MKKKKEHKVEKPKDKNNISEVKLLMVPKVSKIRAISL